MMIYESTFMMFNVFISYLYGSSTKIQCRCMDVFKSWQGEISAVAAAGGKIGGGNIDFFLNDVFGENMFGSRGEQGVIQDTMNAIQEGLDLTHLKTNLFLNEFYSLYNKFAPQSMGDETLKTPPTEDEFLENLNKDTKNKLAEKDIGDHDRYILNHKLDAIKDVRI